MTLCPTCQIALALEWVGGISEYNFRDCQFIIHTSENGVHIENNTFTSTDTALPPRLVIEVRCDQI